MYIKFTVLGEPQGKGRPRFSRQNGRTIVRTPDKTAAYENLIAAEYTRQTKSYKFNDEDRLKLSVTAYYRIPESASKKAKESMRNGSKRPTKKPDVDNVIKVVADSLNGIAYRDDAQIVEAECNKVYADIPRIEVSLLSLSEQEG